MVDILREMITEAVVAKKAGPEYYWIMRGIEQGFEKGIRILVETCQEMGMSKEESEKQVGAKYHLSEERAKDSMEKYWK